MSKTAQLDDDVHALIVDKQKELKRRRSVTVRISDLLAIYVKYGVGKTEELLGLKDDKKPNAIDGGKQGTVDIPEDKLENDIPEDKLENDKTHLAQEVFQKG